MRDAVLNAWWVTAFVPLVVIFGVFFWCDVWLWAFGRARPLSKASATRGFEPFEQLGGELKDAGLASSVSQAHHGQARRHDVEPRRGPRPDGALHPRAAHVPAGSRRWSSSALVTQGLRPLVALAFAIPSGVALFLVLGFVGDAAPRESRGVPRRLRGDGRRRSSASRTTRRSRTSSRRRRSSRATSGSHKGSEPLALFGVGGRTAAYYAGGQPLILKDANGAYDWLMAGEPGSRRFLARPRRGAPAPEPPLSRAHAERAEPPGARRALEPDHPRGVVARLAARRTRTRSVAIVLAEPPKPQHKLDVNLEDKLAGARLRHRRPDRQARRPRRARQEVPHEDVLQGPRAVQSEWEMFIHIDGFHRRHNGDHKVCEGKYPMSLWLQGDVVMDDHEFIARAELQPGAVHALLRPLRRREPAEGEDVARPTAKTASTAVRFACSDDVRLCSSARSECRAKARRARERTLGARAQLRGRDGA